jgi:macrolide-specific efflux system membrane fusion protein
MAAAFNDVKLMKYKNASTRRPTSRRRRAHAGAECQSRPGANTGRDRGVAANGGRHREIAFHRYAEVNAQVAGQIKDVLFAVGDTVREGQLVMEIAPAVRANQLESNRAQMARLRADLADQQAQADFAELQFKRQTQLKAQNATREESVESSRMNLASARARVDSINAQIQQLERR